jgi:hypothetical protein
MNRNSFIGIDSFHCWFASFRLPRFPDGKLPRVPDGKQIHANTINEKLSLEFAGEALVLGSIVESATSPSVIPFREGAVFVQGRVACSPSV